MDFPVTADQVRQTVIDYGITRWVLRSCSLCGAELPFLINPNNPNEVVFSSSCDCVRYFTPPQPSSLDHIAKQFNMQRTPGVAQEMWDSFIASGTKQPPKPVGEVLPQIGTENPRIKVTPDEVAAWLRSVADAHGFTDRETVAVQIAWDEMSGKAPGDYHRETRLDVPELIVMVSNVPNSRVPS